MNETAISTPYDGMFDSVLAPFIETLGVHRQAFEAAAAACANSTASAEKFNKAAAAAKAEADETYKKIRDAYRESGGANTKSVVKLKAEQLAALENHEILASLEKEAQLEASRAEIDMHRAANAYKSDEGTALTAVYNSLMDDFFSNLPPMMLEVLALAETIAARGLSALYQANPQLANPKEFALHEFSTRLKSAYSANQADATLQRVLPARPTGIGSFGASLLALKRMEDELAAREQSLQPTI